MKLYAFWKKKSSFPYVLGGEVGAIKEKGWVYIKSYANTFKPILILPLKEGIVLQEKLDALENDYHNSLKIVKENYDNDLKRVTKGYIDFTTF